VLELHGQEAQDLLVDAQVTLELGHQRIVAGVEHVRVIAASFFLEGISKAALSPVLDGEHLAAVSCNDALQLLEEGFVRVFRNIRTRDVGSLVTDHLRPPYGSPTLIHSEPLDSEADNAGRAPRARSRDN